MPVDHENPPRLPFPVVGIGASAGGLEAMTEFITAMRADSGMAFVFIQHLPPERESMIADILSKKTTMRVRQVEDGMPIEPDHVYVIRPGHVLTMTDGRFHLGPQLGTRAANRPVDDFFRSLAEEQRERAIAVVLSGMGSNGSAGAQAVKAVGGLVIAQDPAEAQFASMPRHLIDQGYADYILRPRDIPEVLLEFAGHPYAKEARPDAHELVRRNESHLREILAILRTRTRTNFSGYKKPTLLRRIQRRMGLTRLTDMGEYARLLRQSPSEVVSLADDILIHVTGFFRDQEAWAALRKHVIVPLVAQREPDTEVRAWVTACSSGEEAYSLAMALVEEAERADKALTIKVFATDMAQRPLEHARNGLYPGGIESEMDPQRLERFFDKEDGVYRIKPFIRERVIFAPQNVLQDPPFSRLDIISCRNLLIYLEPDVQQRLLQLLHFGLREGGALFLGNSETIAGADDLYELVDKRARIYRRIGAPRHGGVDFPMHATTARGTAGAAGAATGRAGAAMTGEFTDPAQSAVNFSVAGATGAGLDVRRGQRGGGGGFGRPSIAQLTQRSLLEHHVLAAVTVDRDFRILYYHGNTRPFLEQPTGEPTRDLLTLARPGLRASIRAVLHRCAAEDRTITLQDGWLETAPDEQVRVAITASHVGEDDFAGADYFVVSFERSDARALGEEGEEGEEGAPTQLGRMRDELHSTIEELQTSNEELRAANEEVTSINEELQSTNEELETSKEEMQSLNEELTSVNAQLQAKMEEHQAAANDLSALLASTDIAVLFLDPNLRIRRWTVALLELMDLIPTDAGRPLADLRRKFDDPQLEADVRRVLDKLIPLEREVTAESGRTYQRRVLPYRTSDNRIDGAVVTFVDMTERKRAQNDLDDARVYAQSIVETLHEPLLVLGPDLAVRSANSAFFAHFRVDHRETLGRKIYDLGNRQWNIPALRTLLEEVLPTNKVFTDYEVIHEFESIGRRVMRVNARQLEHQQLILLGIRDVTEEHTAKARIAESEERLRRTANVPGVGVLTFDPASGALIDANDSFLQMSGYSREQVSGRRLTWRDLTPAEYVNESERQMERLAQTGRIGPYTKQYLHADGSRSMMLFAGAAMGDGTVIEYCVDIGPETEERARASEERFRLVVENVKDYGVFLADADGHITTWNPGAQRIFGYEEREVIGRDADMLFTPEDRAAGEHVKELETARREGRASDDRWQMRKSGERFWASGVTSALRDRADRVVGFVKILRDETNRKALEEQLKKVNEQLEARVGQRTEALRVHQRQLRSLLAEFGREEIRQRRLLASELHDNLAQLLAVCKMRASAIESRLASDPDLRKDAAVVRDVLGDAITYTRGLMTDLRPDVLDEHDLAAAVEWVAKRMARHGLKVTVIDDEKPKPLHEDVLGFLFQAVRELLWNVVKHARTTDATVTLQRAAGTADGNVRVVIEDRGVGFDPSKRKALPGEEGGYGLFSIAERIDLLGGTMQVESAPRRGTRIILTAPLDEASPTTKGDAPPGQ